MVKKIPLCYNNLLQVRGYYSKIVFLNIIILLRFQFFINKKKRDSFVLYILLYRYILF